MGALDYLLLALLGVWLGFVLRSSLRHKGGCGCCGDCARCSGCRK